MMSITISMGNGAITYTKPDMSKVAKLPMTQALFQSASDDIRSGLNLLPSQVAQRLNQRLDASQRLWFQELLQVAALIDNVYWNWGLGYSFEVMIIELKNNLGWRIVEPEACVSGSSIDPVTRKCGTPVIIAADNDVVITQDDSVKASFLSGNMPYILIGALALLLLGRR